VAVTQLGGADRLSAAAEGGGTRIALPAQLTGDYAYSFKLAGYLK
jgi:hypothetical protein